MTVYNTYHLPLMDVFIDTIGALQHFKTLDAYWGYFHINIRRQDRHTIVFVGHAWTLQSIWIPFGIRNSLSCFQRALYLILNKYKWKTCLVYPNDVIICSNNVDGQMKYVYEILTTFMDAGVTLKIKNFHIFQS